MEIDLMNYMTLRYYCLLVLLFCCEGSARAQRGNDCERHFFKGGKLSTSACYEKGTSFGHARAYNRLGEIIFEKQIRKVGGHSYVIFDHYSNGAVKRAEWHDAPDAGIQWYSSITTFSEDGKVLSYTESNYDDHRHTRVLTEKPGTPTKKPLVKKPAETVECAVIYSSEMWFINNAAYPVAVHADRLYRKDESYSAILEPGDTAKCGYLILAQQFANPNMHFSIWLEAGKKSQHPGIAFLKEAPYADSKEKRKYYYTIQ